MKSNSFGEFIILDVFMKHDGKRNRKHCRIKFVITGYEKVVRYDCAMRGKVKDDSLNLYSKTKEYSVWVGMMRRCYEPNYHAYNRYGGKGITVCERWHDFFNFYHDVPLIEGFNRYLFLLHKIELDKDMKQVNVPAHEKVYSLETCMFLTREQNSKYRKWESKESKSKIS